MATACVSARAPARSARRCCRQRGGRWTRQGRSSRASMSRSLLAGDRLLGAVALRVPTGTELADEEVAFVGALANQAALAIDKAALYALERQNTETLRELERARTEFVAVVTHDLRTPLSVIRGYLDLLAEKNGNRKIPIDEAVQQVVRLDQLVDRILAGVRVENPDFTLRRT